MMADEKAWPGNRMSAERFDQERAELRATYGDSKGEAGARFEQALAKLFYRSGWTQEELARKEGKSQRWVSYRLQFGRFLEFSTTGAKTENPAFSRLTERTFRSYWSCTDPAETNERIRFGAVLRLMEEETTLRKRPAKPLRPQIIAEFADGKWHRLSTIVGKVAESEEITKQALDTLVWGQSPQVRGERKQVGASWSYRLFPIKRDSDDGQRSVASTSR